MFHDIENYWQKTKLLDTILRQDVLASREELSSLDSQFKRRVYCRAVLAQFEGTVETLKDYTLTFHIQFLGQKEIAKLTKRLGALESAFHAFDLFTNLNAVSTPLKRDSQEWQILKEAIKIRNRITHPRSATDLEVSKLDVLHLEATEKVMHDILVKSMRRSARSLLKIVKETEKVWKQHNLQRK